MAALCAGTAGYLVLRARKEPAAQASSALRPSPPPPAPAKVKPPSREALQAVLSVPHVSFRSARADEFGLIVVADLAAPEKRRVVTDLACERVYFGGGAGMCLVDKRESVEPQTVAVLVDAEYRVKRSFLMAGFPSRTRVSPDGKYAATTLFVAGDSYNSAGFSTRTSLIDLEKQALLADFDEFVALKDGQRFRKIDFNYWGVTFLRDRPGFYATLATGGENYLIEGDIAKRQVQVVRAHVECPSISPDGRRVAFKSRTSKPDGWRIHVLDLQTKKEHAVEAEQRSVDDQVEWLDDEHLLYGLTESKGLPAEAMNIWVAPVDTRPGERSRIFVAGASSPVVERPRPAQ